MQDIFNNNKSDTLRIAIQKSGRMYQDSIGFLSNTFGINAELKDGCLGYYDNEKDVQVFFCREKDIPQLVNDGLVDMGIAGMNTVYESGNAYKQTIKLGFSKCRLSIAIRDDIFLFTPEQLSGQVIATSYPTILNDYLDENEIDADIYQLSGSVEAAPAMGIATAICDLVETGNTLVKNNLREVAVVMQSEAIAILSNNFEFLQNKSSKIMLDEFTQSRYPDRKKVTSVEPIYLDRMCRTYC